MVQPGAHPSIDGVEAEGNVCAFLDIVDENCSEEGGAFVAPDRHEAIDDHRKLRMDRATINGIHPDAFALWRHCRPNNHHH